MGLAYTTITDEKIPIQVNADLVNFRIERYLNGEFLERRQYKSLEELIQNELENWSLITLSLLQRKNWNPSTFLTVIRLLRRITGC